jgi:type I restriction enzyme S subunit
MPGEWPVVELGQVVDIQTGKLDSNHADIGGAYPFFTCAPEPLRINRYAFDCDAVLLAGNNANGVFHLNRHHGRFNAYQRTYVITPKGSSVIDTTFLFYLLHTLTRRLGEYSQGTATKFLTMGILSHLPVELPPIVEQRAIGHILDSLDDKIELNRRMNETLEAMARALFKSWFVDFDPVRAKAEGRPTGIPPHLVDLFPDAFEDSELGEIPKGWRMGPLDSVLVLQRGFDLPSPKRTSGAYPVLAASGPSGTHNEFMVRGPGVTTGRSGVLGKVFYVHGDFWPLNTSLWVKEFRHSRAAYAFHLLRGLDFGLFNAGSAVPTLNRNHVHNLPTLLPPMGLIDVFERVAVANLARQRHGADQSVTLAALRDALLPKLISGELRVPDAERIAGRAV